MSGAEQDPETHRALLLLQKGNVAEAEAVLQAALRSGRNRAPTLYGLGLVEYRRGNLDLAARMLTESLELDTLNANAYYYLGAILLRQGNQPQARRMFSKAIDVNPSHASALKALGETVGQSAHQDNTVSDSRRPSIAGPYGVYDFLRDDSSPLSIDTIAAMDQLHMNVRPRVIAHSGLIIGLAIWPIIVIAGAVFITEFLTVSVCPYYQCEWVGGLPPEAWMELGLGLGLWLLVFLPNYLRIRTTHVLVEKGRLQIEKGILRRSLVNIELWRVFDVALRQTMVNRMTGDGTLILSYEQGPTRQLERFELTGIARGQRLRDIYQQLLNLVFLLRSNPRVKGVISY